MEEEVNYYSFFLSKIYSLFKRNPIKGKEIFIIKKLCFIFSRGIKKVVY